MSELLGFEQVEIVYERGDHRERVLTDISFSVGRGELVAVTGDRFGGKTTLLRLAAGITLPTRGTVRFGGVDMTSLGAADRDALMSTRISWCGRDGPGLELELRDLIALPAWIRPRSDASPRVDAERLLAQFGIEDCARRCWHELSKWEQMCASLAQGIARRPELLLVDDLLDGFETMRTLEACSTLRRIAAEIGCSVLLTVTNVEAAMLADQRLCLQDGRLRHITEKSKVQAASGELVEFPGRRASGLRR